MLRTWAEFRQAVFNHALENKVPISGQFELTARCNLKCKMCYVCRPAQDKTALHNEISASEWIDLARQARDAGMMYVLLTGGEVFIRNDFRKIYEDILNLGLRITIFTNGTLITPDTARWLAGIPPASIEISLYGGCAETYHKVTGSGQAFTMALRGIDLLLERGVVPSLRTTIIRDNADDFNKLVDIADKRDLLLRYSFYVSPRRGVFNNVDDVRLSPLDITLYEQKAGQAHSDYVKKMRGKHNVIDSYIADTQNIETDNLNGDSKKANIHHKGPFRCSAGSSEFWVTWDGRLTPCAALEEPASMPFKIGFDQAWREMSALCEAVPSCLECLQCSLKEYCWTCPARLKIENNSFEKPAKYLCEWAKHRKNEIARREKLIQK